MSEVISFRLDKTNPREAQALEVLNAWIDKGFSARFVPSIALLGLDHPGSVPNLSQDDRDFDVVLEQIGQVLEILKSIKANPITRQGFDSEPTNLNESFIASIKQGIKTGMKPG